MKHQHLPVLLSQVVSVLAPKPGQTYLDGTAGFGGHAAAILEQIGPDGRAILVDRDAHAIHALAERFDDGPEIIHASYLEAAERLLDDGTLVDMILLDLGVSSPQLDNPERGFSFKTAADLDMRMDQAQALTANEVVNRYPAGRLEQIIRDYGEERRAKAVAAALVAARPIHTTTELARIVRSVVGPSGDIDPATRTFQALRIEVNQELEQLKEALPKLVALLAPHGRIAVISFHSLEDRIVKQFFDRESRDCICPPKQPVCTCGHRAILNKLTPKAITGSTDDVFNPRARSAKLRAAEKK